VTVAAAGPGAQASGPGIVVACWKLVELRAGIDPFTGAVVPDPTSAGPSPADEAALEWALRLAEGTGARVVAISAGSPGCDAMLRKALAAGADGAMRVGVDPDARSSVIAGALARAIRKAAAHGGPGMGDAVVCCGDASVDRGSGSVPAFLAGELAASQALGLVGLDLVTWAEPADGGDRALVVERRLDRGRRERLRLVPPFVISVEAGTARLRRSSLAGALAAREAAVETVEATPPVGDTRVELVGEEPYRPRARVVPAPAARLGPRGRIAVLTGALHERPAARTLVLEPEAAADELLSTLAEWGELPDSLVTVLRQPCRAGAAEAADAAAGAAAESVATESVATESVTTESVTTDHGVAFHAADTIADTPEVP